MEKWTFLLSLTTVSGAVWSNWNATCDCDVNSSNDIWNISIGRTCIVAENENALCTKTDGTEALSEELIKTCNCRAVNGSWAEWETAYEKGTCCQNKGYIYEVRYCRNPEPKWGGWQCLNHDNVTRGIMEYRRKVCCCDKSQEIENAEIEFLKRDPRYLPDAASTATKQIWLIVILLLLHSCI